MAGRLLILGTRKFASEVADIAEDAGYQVVGYVENMDPERCRLPKDDLPVYWIDEVGPLAHDHSAICTLATTRRSRFVEERGGTESSIRNGRASSALVSRRSSVGDGSILGVGCIVATYVTLGSHVLLNRGALIGHHTTVGDYTTVGQGPTSQVRAPSADMSISGCQQLFSTTSPSETTRSSLPVPSSPVTSTITPWSLGSRRRS